MNWGESPELKSDEFSDSNPNIIDITRCEDYFTAGKVLHLFGAALQGRILAGVTLSLKFVSVLGKACRCVPLLH